MKRPKRKKDMSNPYTLNYEEMSNTYTVAFIDAKGTRKVIEIPLEIYEVFNQFELDDISAMHKFDRHIERFDLHENELYRRVINRPKDLLSLTIMLKTCIS